MNFTVILTLVLITIEKGNVIDVEIETSRYVTMEACKKNGERSVKEKRPHYDNVEFVCRKEWK